MFDGVLLYYVRIDEDIILVVVSETTGLVLNTIKLKEWDFGQTKD